MREYKSSLAPYIIGLIKQKQACGYKYDFEGYILESFDRFCIEKNHTADSVTRELVMQWAIQRPIEGKNYRNARVSFVRQLALYMQSLGKNAYIPKHFASETVEVPHLLSGAELTGLFRHCGSLYAATAFPSPLGTHVSSSVSPLLLLWLADLGGLLPATLVRRSG